MNIEHIAIPFFVLALPLTIIILALRFIRQQTEARYRTLLQLADKGVELPLAVLAERKRPEDDRRRGVILLSGAVGLMICLRVLPVQDGDGQHIGDLWGIGLLPMMIGFGYLLNWWLESQAARSALDKHESRGNATNGS